MKTPCIPSSDETLDRHRFYGEIVASFDCAADKVERCNDEISKCKVDLNNASNLLHKQIEHNKALIHEEVAKTNEKFHDYLLLTKHEKLAGRVGEIEEYVTTNKTRWSTSSVILGAVWIVSSGIISWAWNSLNDQIETYKQKIETLEKKVDLTNNSLQSVREDMFRNTKKRDEPPL